MNALGPGPRDPPLGVVGQDPGISLADVRRWKPGCVSVALYGRPAPAVTTWATPVFDGAIRERKITGLLGCRCRTVTASGWSGLAAGNARLFDGVRTRWALQGHYAGRLTIYTEAGCTCVRQIPRRAAETGRTRYHPISRWCGNAQFAGPRSEMEVLALEATGAPPTTPSRNCFTIKSPNDFSSFRLKVYEATAMARTSQKPWIPIIQGADQGMPSLCPHVESAV